MCCFLWAPFFKIPVQCHSEPFDFRSRQPKAKNPIEEDLEFKDNHYDQTMNTLKITVILSLLTLMSCKDRAKKEEKAPEVKIEKEVTASPKQTYAEISHKQGGKWVDRKYESGSKFVNVDHLDLPEEHTDHSYYIRYEGPGWENGQVGYRLYLDWRNAIDIFGKKTDTMVLQQVGQDGFDSYHEMSPWGADILKVGKALGIGSIGRYVQGEVRHFENVESTGVDIENTDNSSSVEIDYKGWKTLDKTIDLRSKLTIFPEDRYTLHQITPSAKVKGICTGIVKFEEVPLLKKEGEKWGYIATYGKQTLVSDDDQLGMAVFYKLDDVESVSDSDYDHLVVFKPVDTTVDFYFMAAWEQEPNGLKTEKEFLDDIDAKLDKLDKSDSI